MQKEIYMQRAFDLALRGIGKVSPNPMVGCVIVKDEVVIGEGWHQKYGEKHAEANAIESVSDKSLLDGADIYVSLEPCAHFGKQPPCADLICGFSFRKVIVSNPDPFPLVAGNGFAKIRNAGIDLETGLLEKEGRLLNRRFFTVVEKKRPYIILKWAQTADGYIAREDFSSKWISNEVSRKLVHKWRTEEDAIMVGRNTATCDNPQLNARLWEGRNPIRILIDPDLAVPAEYHLLDKSQLTIIYNKVKSREEENLNLVKIDHQDFIARVIEDLYQRKVQSVIIEGGSTLVNSFLENDLWDEIRRFTAPVLFEKGIGAPQFRGIPVATENIAGDQLEVFMRES
jgi:diaminohydroxyphosphoribosylaminopyrimidine deaminase / 5-amino-6-(5-phosphoribosylamino)uracil reductase